MISRVLSFCLLGFAALILSQCAPSVDPAVIAERQAKIASEPTGDFYIGRRYHVDHTRFWGYLRKPRTPWSKAKLVMMNETRGIKVPDRLPEYGSGRTHGYDNNYQYKVYGRYASKPFYDPNSNQFLPQFIPSRFELLDPNPGWLFSPAERYTPNAITLTPRSR